MNMLHYAKRAGMTCKVLMRTTAARSVRGWFLTVRPGFARGAHGNAARE